MPHPAVHTKLPTNYEAARAAAWVRLSQADAALQAAHLGGAVTTGRDGGRVVAFPCMGMTYRVDMAGTAVSRDNGGPVTVFTEILILHALLGHTGRPVTGRWIAFSDIPDGLLYTSVYEKRTAQRLARAISGAGGALAAAAGRIGGSEAALGGDQSAVVEPFAGVPVGIVYWAGDDQFTPAVTFLYDSTITEIFPAEDVVVLTQWVTEAMIDAIKEAAV